MSGLQGMLDKLNKLTLIRDKGRNTLKSKEGFTIFIETKFQHSKNAGFIKLSVQPILYVTYKNKKVATWGCCDPEDSKLVIDWFVLAEARAQENEWKIEKKDEAEGKKLFNSLVD